MPSTCPKCHAVLEEDEICCAQVRYTWRCKSCFKLTSGFAVPYGKCFMCGGELELIPGRDLGDSMRFRAIRDAVQFELDSFHFRSEEHTSELQSLRHLVCRLLLGKKKSSLPRSANPFRSKQQHLPLAPPPGC